jgi:hypothetical protein
LSRGAINEAPQALPLHPIRVRAVALQVSRASAVHEVALLEVGRADRMSPIAYQIALQLGCIVLGALLLWDAK